MFKRHHQVFTALRVLLDVLVVAGSFATAHALRFGFPDLFPYPEVPQRRETIAVGLLACILWPLCLRSVGLYRAQRQSTALDEVFGVFKATALGGILLVTVTYFFREDRYSRGALVLFTILAFAGDSQGVFVNGYSQESEADTKKRLGEEASRPKRIRFKPLTK